MYSAYQISVNLIFVLAAIVFPVLMFVSAPYGKFLRKGWGPVMRSKWAWMIMEMPSPVLLSGFFLTSDNKYLPYLLFIGLWLIHYVDRAFIYPFLQSGKDKPYPVLLVAMAFLFNILNGLANGYGVFHFKSYDIAWMGSWQFITGISLFASGYLVNRISDARLRGFRKGNIGEYVLPRGWLFKYISCPHYFGEIVEWTGWAFMTWSLPGLAFSVFTFANLFPRAISSHKWYLQQFPDYPVERKAVIPFVI